MTKILKTIVTPALQAWVELVWDFGHFLRPQDKDKRNSRFSFVPSCTNCPALRKLPTLQYAVIMKLFKTAQELVDFLSQQKRLPMQQNGNQWTYTMKGNIVFGFDTAKNQFSVTENGNPIRADRDTSKDLTKPENHSVVMLLINLLERGYGFNTITLEKTWQTGHSPIYLDVMIQNPDPSNPEVYMIEVKNMAEFQKYTNANDATKVKQLCSYAMQEQTTSIASFYSYDFDKEDGNFANIFCTDLRKVSLNVDDFYDRWNKIFDNTNYISFNNPFCIQKKVLTYSNLRNIYANDTKILFNQFLTILRLNSISDKPTAFMRMINLFLAKLTDEIYQDTTFTTTDIHGSVFNHNGLRFQYVDAESPESFLKRLNELYKEGMQKCLNKAVIDYTDAELAPIIRGGDQSKLMKAFDNLRLKKNNSFSFIEVYDDTTFLENFAVVKDVVQLLQNFKFKYTAKQQFLGDFFEDLLNTSLKQEAGQFFTPYPLVDYMVDSLDIESQINRNLNQRNLDFVPKVIDYACGAGHFIISAMTAIQDNFQKIVTSPSFSTYTKPQQTTLKTCIQDPYSWANSRHIVGVEKDYRLAKTTKIATFLNGDGEAEIIAGDGIAKFSCPEYAHTVLASNSTQNEYFDYVISNPPYSVDGFMQNFKKNGISATSKDFSLLTGGYNLKDSRIEIFFVERAAQLLKTGGIAAIILPQSILAGEKYNSLRTFIYKNFRIMSILLTADITFSGTTTSPVVLFLRKENVQKSDYEILIHMSPKYKTPNAAKMKGKEVDFLGYEFSSNRSKSGIEIKPASELQKLAPLTCEFIETGSISGTLNPAFSKIVKLSDITLNRTANYCGDVYPKYERPINGGNPLSKYCKINEWKASDFSLVPTNYLEIGDLKTQIPSKRLSSNRFCKSGDILISSLGGIITIAKGDFMLTGAVYVLSSFNNITERNFVYNRLHNTDVTEQISALMDGFKITYAKISEHNLFNNVLI